MNAYRSSSAWTGRAPRTCQQAFGPYTSYQVQDPVIEGSRYWLCWAVVCVVLLGLVAFVVP